MADNQLERRKSLLTPQQSLPPQATILRQESADEDFWSSKTPKEAAEAACLFLRDAFEGHARVHPMSTPTAIAWYRMHLKLALQHRVGWNWCCKDSVQWCLIDVQLPSLLEQTQAA